EAIAGRALKTLEEAIETLQRSLHLAEPLLAPLDRAAVVRAQEQEAYRLRLMLLEQIDDVDDIAHRPGHLGLAHLQQAIVHPVTGERLARVRLRLCQLVLMVRELEVEAAAVDIERAAQEFHTHGGALDVPTRSPRPPRAVPRRLAGLRPFPEREVAGVALLIADLDAGAGLHLLRVAVAELAVVGVLGDV